MQWAIVVPFVYIYTVGIQHRVVSIREHCPFGNVNKYPLLSSIVVTRNSTTCPLSGFFLQLFDHHRPIMGIKVQRTRCFLDIGISNVLGKEGTLIVTAYILLC